MPHDKNRQSSGNQQSSSGNSQQSGSGRSSSREQESMVNREPSDRSSWSSRADRSAQRDNQQAADENEQSGVVDTEEVRNRASDMEQAEGSRENAGGISNRDLGEERESQSHVPRRGHSREDESA
jgi:hypothetical protein